MYCVLHRQRAVHSYAEALEGGQWAVRGRFLGSGNGEALVQRSGSAPGHKIPAPIGAQYTYIRLETKTSALMQPCTDHPSNLLSNCVEGWLRSWDDELEPSDSSSAPSKASGLKNLFLPTHWRQEQNLDRCGRLLFSHPG